jgi:hypothetical protein
MARAILFLGAKRLGLARVSKFETRPATTIPDLNHLICLCRTELSVLVLGRVKDSSSHDSILFAFFAGEREDLSR